jgi:transcriptional regulator GlxA family with amidase domain
MPRIVIAVFDGVQTLDLTGPAEVFAAAGRPLGGARGRAHRAHYEVVAASIGGGERTTTSGLGIDSRALARIAPRSDDTVIVAGGGDRAVASAAADRALLAWLGRAAPVVARIASVCSGAFILAAAGLLDGKRATTHWSACDRLAKQFPRVAVDRNAIFVTDGKTWSSAGVTTGIDMSLAMVEHDLGAQVADAVAARLVLYVRRPGYQSQWSDALVAQHTAKDPLAPAIAWARANLTIADSDSIARRAGLSPRTFHRRCLAHLSTTPAKLLDKLRVERARDLLASRALPLKALAASCGFTSPARMKRAFERELGLGPRAYRLLHA